MNQMVYNLKQHLEAVSIESTSIQLFEMSVLRVNGICNGVVVC